MEFHAAVEYTKADIKIYQRFHRKTKRRAMSIISACVLVLAAVLIVPVIVISIIDRAPFAEYAFMAAAFVLLIVLYFLRDSINAYAMLKRRVKGTEHMEYVFDDECFKVDCSALKEQYGYEAFKELYRVKGIFLLYVDKRHAVILPERCFTLGTPDDFVRFIEEKTGKNVINKK